jgi:hypothetical protein
VPQKLKPPLLRPKTRDIVESKRHYPHILFGNKGKPIIWQKLGNYRSGNITYIYNSMLGKDGYKWMY